MTGIINVFVRVLANSSGPLQANIDNCDDIECPETSFGAHKLKQI
jgi:hypothetical protein